MKQELKI